MSPPPKKKPATKAATKQVAKATAKKTSSPSKPATPPDPHAELRFVIDSAWARRTALTLEEIEGSTRPAIDQAIEGLESGAMRVAEPDGKGGWQVNEWLKKAVLLYFRTSEMELVESYPAPFWD